MAAITLDDICNALDPENWTSGRNVYRKVNMEKREPVSVVADFWRSCLESLGRRKESIAESQVYFLLKTLVTANRAEERFTLKRAGPLYVKIYEYRRKPHGS